MEKSTPSGPASDLEASTTSQTPRKSTLTQRWTQNLDPANADLICLVLCFLTGLCDSSAYNAWSCFLGMQTGKTPPFQHRFERNHACCFLQPPTPIETLIADRSQEIPFSWAWEPPINRQVSHGAGSSPLSPSSPSSPAR